MLGFPHKLPEHEASCTIARESLRPRCVIDGNRSVTGTGHSPASLRCGTARKSAFLQSTDFILFVLLLNCLQLITLICP